MLAKNATMVSTIIVCALCLSVAAAEQVEKKTEAPKAAVATTLDNLQAAFNGESNARAKYEAFAKKADEEGYHQVASLFRAAAKAEEIHANNHAEVIRKMGAEPTADVKTPEVKSTRENLETAVNGETYEITTMYPGFIKQGEVDKNTRAVRSYNFAVKAESEHAKYYKEALANLDAWKTGKKDFLVCPECGYTTTTTDIKKCPVCSEPRKKLLEIS